MYTTKWSFETGQDSWKKGMTVFWKYFWIPNTEWTPNIFGKVCISKNVAKSDYSSVFIFPKVGNPPVRSVVEFIDALSDHHKSLMLQKLQAIDWSTDSLLKIISTLLLTSSILLSMNSSRTAFPLYGSKCHQKTLLLSRLLHHSSV